MYTQKGPAETQGVRAKYSIVVSKLRIAVAKHKEAFPHLATIEDFFSIPMSETGRDIDYILRLDGLCSCLDKLSTGSYVILHLHNNLCSAVEAVGNNMPVEGDTLYIQLPG